MIGDTPAHFTMDFNERHVVGAIVRRFETHLWTWRRSSRTLLAVKETCPDFSPASPCCRVSNQHESDGGNKTNETHIHDGRHHPPHPQPPIIHDINQTHQILLRQPTRLTHILMTRVRDTHPQPEQIPPLPPTLVPLICQKGTRPVGRITDEAQDAVGRLLSRGGVEDEEFAERGSVGEHGGGGRAEG